MAIIIVRTCETTTRFQPQTGDATTNISTFSSNTLDSPKATQVAGNLFFPSRLLAAAVAASSHTIYY